MARFLRYYLPVLVWLIIIFLLPTIITIDAGFKAPPYFDKVYHVFEFLVLGILLLRALYYAARNPDRMKAYLMTSGIIIFIAGADELHQIYIPGRVASVFDFTADIIGLLAAVFIFRAYLKTHNK